MGRSNISIKSNIYVNRTNSQFDKDFIRHVYDYDTLRKIKEYLDKDELILTQEQRELLDKGNPRCSLDTSGDKSWGVIIENDVPTFVCKCEKIDCKLWAECSVLHNFRKITRRPEDTASHQGTTYIPPDFGLLRYLDEEDRQIYLETFKISSEINEPPEIPFDNTENPIEDKFPMEEEKSSEEKKTLEEENPQTKGEDAIDDIISPQDDDSFPVKYELLDGPDEIIKANIDDRIIVNAGPGTGKTYSVIKRLEYIINNKLANPERVLVLCYSRSAVGEIKKRLKDEIREGLVPRETMSLFEGIRTFDSFVTYMLSDGELEGVINNLDYDDRIEKFISEFNKDTSCLEGLEYLIIDEIQDLVGVRARLVKTLLEHLKCGFLLLGDVCQSIYDYLVQDENELNSSKFYKWLNTKFYTGVKRFELTNNVRQSRELAKYEKDMRNAILSKDVSKQEETLAACVNELQQKYCLGNIRYLDSSDFNKFEAILCRNNAEVSIISTELFEKDINHCILKSAQHVDLVPWIAEILSTYTEKRIGFEAFKKRAIKAGYNDAEDKWRLLKNVASDDSQDVLDVRLLVKLLVAAKDLPAELDLSYKSITTVSTIHRAKGREYNGVILLSDDYDGKYCNHDELNKKDEIKVAYVALTRGKRHIGFCNIPRHYIIQLDSKRWIATKLSQKNGKPYCYKIYIGMDGDIDPFSFVNKNIEDAQKRQEYIGKLKPGDILEINRTDMEYGIYHEGFFIGRLSDKIVYDLKDAMGKTNHSPTLPSSISRIYVNNIVTIANTKFNDEIAEPYNKSGLWLGVEISGFAKTHWW